MWVIHSGVFEWFFEQVLLTVCSRGVKCIWGTDHESLFQGQCYVVIHWSCQVLFLLEAPLPPPWP